MIAPVLKTHEMYSAVHGLTRVQVFQAFMRDRLIGILDRCNSSGSHAEFSESLIGAILFRVPCRIFGILDRCNSVQGPIQLKIEAPLQSRCNFPRLKWILFPSGASRKDNSSGVGHRDSRGAPSLACCHDSGDSVCSESTQEVQDFLHKPAQDQLLWKNQCLLF